MVARIRGSYKEETELAPDSQWTTSSFSSDSSSELVLVYSAGSGFGRRYLPTNPVVLPKNIVVNTTRARHVVTITSRLAKED